MINNIMGGPGINVQGGQSSFPYVPQNSSNPIQGMLRLSNQELQVFDGSTWLNVGTNYSTIELNSEAQALLKWAHEQRDKQYAREAKMKDNPALQKAFEAICRAEENFDLLYKFVENDKPTNVQTSP